MLLSCHKRYRRHYRRCLVTTSLVYCSSRPSLSITTGATTKATAAAATTAAAAATDGGDNRGGDRGGKPRREFLCAWRLSDEVERGAAQDWRLDKPRFRLESALVDGKAWRLAACCLCAFFASRFRSHIRLFSLEIRQHECLLRVQAPALTLTCDGGDRTRSAQIAANQERRVCERMPPLHVFFVFFFLFAAVVTRHSSPRL